MTMRYLRYPLVTSLFLVFAATALQAKPVALATNVTGTTTPAVEMFSELQDKSKIVLEGTAEIEFLHYPSCQTIVVRGGTLSFTAERYLLRKGKIVSTKRAKCPKKVALTGASQIGGLVLRSGGGGKKLRVATNPSFVMVGNGAPRVESIRVTQDGKEILEVAKPGRSFDWPDDAPQLVKGRDYLVTLTLTGEAKPKTFTVSVKGSGGKNAITLIRLD